MNQDLKTTVAVDIKAAPPKVWTALTDPSIIKQYLFGADTKSDFKEGSTITWEGEYEGKPYIHKGTIEKVEPGRLLKHTFLSDMQEDKPENYANVTYTIEENEESTRLTLTQDNISDEKEKEGNTKNWTTALEKLKEVVEGESLENSF